MPSIRSGAFSRRRFLAVAGSTGLGTATPGGCGDDDDQAAPASAAQPAARQQQAVQEQAGPQPEIEEIEFVPAVARIADDLIVLRDGETVERCSALRVLSEPAAPCSRTLVKAAPPLDREPRAPRSKSNASTPSTPLATSDSRSSPAKPWL